MMQWSDDEFRKRAQARASELGKTLADAGRDAGLAEHYFRKPPAQGRNIAHIFKLAATLKMDPAELMGLRRSDEELAKVVTLAVSLYFHLSAYPPGDLEGNAADIIPRAIAKALKLVRKEFAAAGQEVAAEAIEREADILHPVE
jgi:hypothetical protein